MLSPDGRCQTFSAKANGFARGEGCGAVLLAPYQATEQLQSARPGPARHRWRMLWESNPPPKKRRLLECVQANKFEGPCKVGIASTHGHLLSKTRSFVFLAFEN